MILIFHLKSYSSINNKDLFEKIKLFHILQNMGEPNTMGAARGEECQTPSPPDGYSCQPD